MPHHVHPYAHRIGTLRDWKSRWIAFGADYQKYLKGDVLLRGYLVKRLRGMHVSDIEMERNDKTWKIVIKTARPGLIIGRSGEGAVKLKSEVLSRLARWKMPHPKDIKIEIEEVRNPESNAAIVGAMVAEGVARTTGVGETKMIFIAGRYEGIDERVIESKVDEEWSIGDYILSGGELAAMVMVDAITRLLPGALGHAESAQQDSFMSGLLDFPHYTRPEEILGKRVPPVLLSGNHQAIKRWRLKQSLGRTWLRRPDLLTSLNLDKEQQRLLAEFIEEQQR